MVQSPRCCRSLSPFGLAILIKAHLLILGALAPAALSEEPKAEKEIPTWDWPDLFCLVDQRYGAAPAMVREAFLDVRHSNVVYDGQNAPRGTVTLKWGDVRKGQPTQENDSRILRGPGFDISPLITLIYAAYNRPGEAHVNVVPKEEFPRLSINYYPGTPDIVIVPSKEQVGMGTCAMLLVDIGDPKYFAGKLGEWRLTLKIDGRQLKSRLTPSGWDFKRDPSVTDETSAIWTISFHVKEMKEPHHKWNLMLFKYECLKHAPSYKDVDACMQALDAILAVQPNDGPLLEEKAQLFREMGLDVKTYDVLCELLKKADNGELSRRFLGSSQRNPAPTWEQQKDWLRLQLQFMKMEIERQDKLRKHLTQLARENPLIARAEIEKALRQETIPAGKRIALEACGELAGEQMKMAKTLVAIAGQERWVGSYIMLLMHKSLKALTDTQDAPSIGAADKAKFLEYWRKRLQAE